MDVELLCRKLTEIESQIVQLIRKFLSPEQASAYLKKHMNFSISQETIYRYIYADKQRHEELKPFLRQGKKLRRKRYGSGARASNIPNRICISERPKVVEQKSKIGDWECDSVIGLDRKSALVTVVERKTLLTCCMRVFEHTAETVSQAKIEMLVPHMDKAKTYFSHPYASYERGINENTNGLIRQFFPKRTDLRKVTAEEIQVVIESINNRPRKTRGYRTPNELFNSIFVPLL